MFAGLQRPLHLSPCLFRRRLVHEIILYYFPYKMTVSPQVGFDKMSYLCYTMYAFTCVQDRATQRCDPSGIQGLARRVVHIASLFFCIQACHSPWKTKAINRIPARRRLGLWGSATKSLRLLFHLSLSFSFIICLYTDIGITTM